MSHIDWYDVITSARASTVAHVVPSPAFVFVFVATSWTNLAPIISNLSSNSIAFATLTLIYMTHVWLMCMTHVYDSYVWLVCMTNWLPVNPSLVIFGLPQLCLIITVFPFELIWTHPMTSSSLRPARVIKQEQSRKLDTGQWRHQLQWARYTL